MTLKSRISPSHSVRRPVNAFFCFPDSGRQLRRDVMDVIDRPMAQEKCFVAASKIVSPGGLGSFKPNLDENHQRRNTNHHTNHHVLTTFLQSKYPVFGLQPPEETGRQTGMSPTITKNPPQLTTTPGKTRRLVFSTAKWSVLSS